MRPDDTAIREARLAAWRRRAILNERVIRHRRNGLVVLIGKIGGLRRMYADCKARGVWDHPGEAWWRAQLPSLRRLIAHTR